MERAIRVLARFLQGLILTAAGGVVLCLTCLVAGAADEPYRHLSDENAGFECDVPAGWSELQLKGISIIGPASDAGYKPRLDVRYYQNGENDFASAQDYIETMTGSKQMSAGAAALLGIKPPPQTPPLRVDPIRVAEMDGSQFEKNEKYMRGHSPRKAPTARTRYWGAIPLRHAYVVLPVKDGFWVLTFSAEIEEFKKYRDHFDRLLKTFKPRIAPEK